MGVRNRAHQVLVVDDDPDVRALYVDALEELGHQVTIAANGTAALDELRTRAHPCVILTDLRMPQMDGFELRREVARDPQLSTIPIVVITGDRILSYTSPALDKPFSPAELDALVQRSCTLHRVPATADAGPGDGTSESGAGG